MIGLGTHNETFFEGEMKRFFDFAFEETFTDRLLDEILDGFADQTGTLLGSKALMGDVRGHIFANGDGIAFFLETLREGSELESDDLLDDLGGKRSEDNRLVEAREEFGTEFFLQFCEDLALDGFELIAMTTIRSRPVKSNPSIARKGSGADV